MKTPQKKREKKRRLNPFIEHNGQIYVAMNWDFNFDDEHILLLRPLTDKEKVIYHKSRKSQFTEIFSDLFYQEEKRWTGQ